MQNADVSFTAGAGGHPLAGTLFSPGADLRGAVLLAGAMGVKRRFYAPFAQHLAGSGLAVLTFDYLGIGDSRPASLRGLKASVHGWAEEDLPAALAYLQQRFPDAPLSVVAHSVGGQLLGMVPGIDRIAGAFMVASQVGYWKHWSGLPRAGMWLLWHAGIPMLTGLLGYYPMGRVGMGEDLPSGVAREWAKWGRHPEYLFGYLQERPSAAFDRFQRPLLSWAIADDGYAPVSSVRALFERYQSPRKAFEVIDPAAAGQKRIGHFGFFRKDAGALWQRPMQWLLEVSAQRR